MPLNLADLCLLLPQDLLSTYPLSQPIAIQVHQVLAQLQQALSLEESLQANTINAALQQLTPLQVIPLGKEFSTGTNLRYQQVQEFDRYMEIQHVKAEQPAKLIVMSLLRAYLGFLEISAGLAFNPNKAFVKSGFTAYVLLLIREFGLEEYNSDDNINNSQELIDSHANFNIESNFTLSPLQIWKKEHWVFSVFSQGLIISLNRLVDAIVDDQLEQAKVEIETAAELMYASGAAMKLTIKDLQKFEKSRAKILDPQGRVTGKCPLNKSLKADLLANN